MRTTLLPLLGCVALAAGIFLPAIRAEDRMPIPRGMPQPDYPYEMARAFLQGMVEVEFIIDAHGDVVDTRVTRSTNRGFEMAALQAVQKWKFTPAERAGRPVAVKVRQTVEFALDLPPVYPLDLLLRKVEGSATVDVQIGADGRVIGTELIDATDPAFGRAVEAAVAFTTYAPALPGSGANKTTRRVKEYFMLDGSGQAKISDSAKKILRQLGKNSTFVGEKELDGPLVLKTAPAPVYPPRLAPERAAGTAVVEAFIDEKGEVQLPRVVSATREEFGAAASQAISTWRYEPPKKNRKATLVQVQIPVEFGPEDAVKPTP